jgi:hypothetical protein
MTTRLGIGAAVAALLAAALSTTVPASAGAQDPLLGAPAVGQCFDLSPEELAQPTYPEAAIDCATPHTAQTLAVAQLPVELAYDSPDLDGFALETCFAAQREALGLKNMTKVSLTAYYIGYFVPSAEQQAAGARWLRCDLVLGQVKKLHPLPDKLTVGKKPKKAVARCLTGRDFRVTVCAEKHTYRATGAFTIPGKKFPSVRKWQELGEKKCLRVVSTRQFRFGWPSEASWDAGDRSLTCYTKTKR